MCSLIEYRSYNLYYPFIDIHRALFARTWIYKYSHSTTLSYISRYAVYSCVLGVRFTLSSGIRDFVIARGFINFNPDDFAAINWRQPMMTFTINSSVYLDCNNWTPTNQDIHSSWSCISLLVGVQLLQSRYTLKLIVYIIIGWRQLEWISWLQQMDANQ